MARRYSLAEFQARLDARHPNRFTALSYEHSHLPCTIECRVCGTQTTVRADTALKKMPCQGCVSRRETFEEKAQEKAERATRGAKGIDLIETVPGGTRIGFKFFCHKHGVFHVPKLREGAVKCPKCSFRFTSNHPDHIPARARKRAAVLYLLEIEDSVGKWIKVGISTDFKRREVLYRKQGIKVLRVIRMYKTTLYRAAVIEMELKRWARKVLGRRKTPRQRWSGWSESFKDRAAKFPSQFDRFVLDTRFDV